MHPGQQQGRRFPSAISVYVRLMRCALVSGFLASSIQQINSLRAKGVISSHAASDAGRATSFSRKSEGILCTTPPEILFIVIYSFYTKHVANRAFLKLAVHDPIFHFHCLTPFLQFLFSQNILDRTRMYANFAMDVAFPTPCFLSGENSWQH